MPVSDHYQWVDIADFTAGVWDTSGAYNKFAAPSNAFITLDDYQPMKGGGLRAFFTPDVITLSLSSATNEVPIGIFARNGWSRSAAHGGTGNDSTDMVLVTLNVSDFKFRVYRRDGSVASPTWSLRYTSAAGSGNGHQVTQFEYFMDSTGKEWYLMSISAASGEAGLYKMQVDNTTTSNDGITDGIVSLASTHNGPVCVSQGRVMVGGGASIFYSDTGLTTNITHETPVTVNRTEPAISIITGVAPSDLLIGKEGAPWNQISGDITTATIREMGANHYPRQDKQPVPRTPNGICFIEPGGRVFETDGRNFVPLSNQLGGRTLNWTDGMVGAGAMGFLNDFLFAPGNNGATRGLVYDFQAGCWFRVTGLNHVFTWADPFGGYVWAANHERSGGQIVAGYGVFGNSSRVLTGVIQTVPYADKNGRNIDIREVQLFVNTYGTTTEFKVELIDENDSSVVTRYGVVPTAHREMVKFQFPATKSEYLSVKITPTAATTEAPTIERLRIGFGINNLVV